MSLMPLIVGQAPSRSDPSGVLMGASGRRIAVLAGLEFPGEYASRFWRRNLVDVYLGKASGEKGDSFDLKAGRAKAEFLLPLFAKRRVVLLGRAVASCFRHLNPTLDMLSRGGPLHAWYNISVHDLESWQSAIVAVAAHPSGVSHYWNDPKNVRRARRFWREFSRPSDFLEIRSLHS